MAVFPVFLKLAGRRVVVVGGGPVAASKLRSLIDAEASVTVIAPEVVEAIASAPVEVVRRPFRAEDLDGAWYVVAAAPPEVNRAVAAAAHERNLFVNAVDDLENASAYLGAVLRRAGVTIALSTDGEAPALVGLMREALEAGTARRFGHVDGNRARRATAVAGGGHSDGAATAAAAGSTRQTLREAASRLVGRTMSLRANDGPLAPGTVALVGAGPGDPDLLTRRAERRLAEADLVLYDALIDPAVLDLAPTARRVYVGKRAGRHSVSQEFINKLMVRAARRGQRVVRLKGGDPFVFGRGGEEALALANAGIAFEIVPGISSAVAAAELAGIPVTHRSMSAGFLVVSGHAESAYRAALDSLEPNSITVVVMMGLASVEKIASLLIDRGWNPLTPAAVLLGASTSASDVWTLTLGDLRRGVDFEETTVPGTVVIGDVVGIRAALLPKFAAPGSAERKVSYAHRSR